MSHRAAAVWEKGLGASMLLLAFLTPLGFYVRTYDSSLVKNLLLQVGLCGAVLCGLLKAVELGRAECPVTRLALRNAAALLLAWTLASILRSPSLPTAIEEGWRQAGFVLLFILVLAGPASASFAAALSDWTLAAAALASSYALLQRAGADPFVWKGAFGASSFSTLAHPQLLGVFLAAAAPIGLSRAFDPERPRPMRAASAAAAFLCVLGVVAAGSWVGLLTLGVCAAAFSAAALSVLRSPGIRLAALGPAALLPAAAGWALSRAPADQLAQAWAERLEVLRGTWRLWGDHLWLGVGTGGFSSSFQAYRSMRLMALEGRHNVVFPDAGCEPLQVAAELGLAGLALWLLVIGASLVLAWRDLSRRARRGEEREAALMAGQWAAVLGLLAAGAFGMSLRHPAPGLHLWLLAGSLAGLALERGSSVVEVRPIPFSPEVRRLLYAPALIAAVGTAAQAWRALDADVALNRAVYLSKAGQWDRALGEYAKVPSWHPSAALARYFAGNVHMERNARGDLQEALSRYRETQLLHPRFAEVDYRMGDAHARLAEWDHAALSLLQAVRADPLHAPAFRQLADAASVLGWREEARMAALGLVRAAPQDPSSWTFLSDLYRARGNRLAARRLDEKARRARDLARRGQATPVF